MVEGRIHRILAPTFVDGPGARMAVFLQGCDLACPTCHNPETRGLCDFCGGCVEGCPHGALEWTDGGVAHDAARCTDCGTCEATCPRSGSPRVQRLSPDALLARAESWGPMLDGLTFSGGEASLQADFLREAGALVKARLGWTWLVDTHGGMPEATFAALLEAGDGFLFDLKAPTSALHQRLTGQPLGQRLFHLHRAAEAGKLVELRLLLVPGATAEPEAFEALLAIAADLPGAFPVRLQAYRHHGVRGPGLAFPELTADALIQCVDRASLVLGRNRVHTPATIQ